MLLKKNQTYIQRLDDMLAVGKIDEATYLKFLQHIYTLNDIQLENRQ